MKRALYFLTVFAGLSLVSCGGDEPAAVDTPASISVSPSSLSFTGDGETKTLTVNASGAWTASKNDSWISVDPSYGSGNATVSVKAGYNSTGARRTATIAFSINSDKSVSSTVGAVQEAVKEAEEVTVVPSPRAFDGTKRSGTTYQMLVYSFADGAGNDGIGDFKGIENKLDYLDGLGVTALWLSPIHPSDSYHGYDVKDYYTVNPTFGTEDDFKSLLSAAHAKGIKIYIDYVLNHSGKGNTWFTQALSDPSSPYRNYYFFSSNPSADYGSFPMLKGTSYQSGEWKQATSGSPKLKITKTEEAVTNGSSTWNLWLWKSGQDGKEVKFVDKGDGTYYLVADLSGSYGMLVRKYPNWNAGSKFGAVAGNTTLKEGEAMSLTGDGADISFTGSGRYKIELSDVNTETLYYMAAFSDWMPDLNYGDLSTCENNSTFKDLAASADKWIKMGVDGLRLDAVKHICGGIDSYNNSSNQTFLGKWYDHCNATYKAAGHDDNIFMVGEAYDSHGTEKLYYEGLISNFEFSFGWTLKDVLNNGSGAPNFVSDVTSWIADHKAKRSDAITSIFLTNHDQDRWASEIGRNAAREKQAAAILLTTEGKPFVYQGEELGYWGTTGSGDEYVRTPIMWDKSGSDLAVNGVNNKIDNSMLTASISVEAQSGDENSLLNVYKAWSRLRNTYPALAAGSMSKSAITGSTIASWYMTSGSEKLLVVHNVGSSEVNVVVSDDMSRPVALLGTAKTKGNRLTLGPNSSVVFEL